MPILSCLTCQATLADGEHLTWAGGPCPHCGGTHLGFQAEVKVAMSVSATADAGRRGSYRQVRVLDTQRPIVFDDVKPMITRLCGQSWPPSRDELRAEPVLQRALREAEAFVTNDHRGRYVRARRGLDDQRSRDRAQFLARRPASSPARYNPGGYVCLYLAQSAEVARAEVRAEPGDTAHAIAFDVDLRGRRVLELPLSADDRAPTLNALLWIAEVEAAGDDSVYRPSHIARWILDDLGVEAIQYPSVRAGMVGLPPARNLLVFATAVELVEAQMVGAPFEIPSTS